MHVNTNNSHPLSQPLNTKLNIRACSVSHFVVTHKLKFLCVPVSQSHLCTLTVQNGSVLLNWLRNIIGTFPALSQTKASEVYSVVTTHYF